jgi:putative membrane protein
MDVAKFFSPADLAEVAAAVREVEARSAGEIVPYAVGSSDTYPSAVWKAATLGALLAALAAAVAYELGGLWGPSPALWLALPPPAGAALGYLGAALIPALRRALLPPELLDQQVRQRALAAFVEQEVFRTKGRTGILVFLSLFERRVVILADQGITTKVGQPEWDAIVAGVVAGIRGGAPGRALADGILHCGDLLARHGVAAAPGDVDELPDRLRMEPS